MLKYFKPINKDPKEKPNAKPKMEQENPDRCKRIKIDHGSDENVAPQEPDSLTLPPCPDQELLGLEWTTMKPDWLLAFHKELSKEYFLEIKRYLLRQDQARKIIFPPAHDVYSFTACPLNKVRVVILGQDPYHGPGQAHGLCFSVRKGVPPPPSLVNIYKELASDLGDVFQIPKHGYLHNWCEQGVLLLNASLTVEKANANSHSKIGWEKFTDAIIHFINKNNKNVVFLLWGGNAQKKCASIDKKKHHVLTSVHPSPLSAHRGFLGCKHFSKTNDYLEKMGLKPINWNAINNE